MGCCCGHSSTLAPEQQEQLNQVSRRYKLSSSVTTKIEQAWVRADGDGNKMLDYTEFLHVLDLQNSKIAQALFRSCDADTSGDVDIAEFAEVMAKVDTYDDDHRISWTFSIYDADGSHTLDLDELHEHLNDANSALRFPKDRLRQIFKQPDTRNRVTFAEFKAKCSEHPLLELPVQMIFQKVKAMIFDFDSSDTIEGKHTQFDARKGQLVKDTDTVTALTAYEGQVSLGGNLNGREF